MTRRARDYSRHVIMFREVSPVEVLDPLIQPVCMCGWEGVSHMSFTDADAEGNFHLQRYERFPRLVVPD